MALEVVSQAKGRINLEKAAVLLVESSAQGMDIATQVLIGIGVRTPTRVESIDAAWQMLKLIDFDLIVCSASLSDGDGYDFISALRRSDIEPNRFASVIVLAGHTPMADVRKARDCGANFVVAKPISPRILLERIIWIARETRPFIEVGNIYTGPDRRFQNLGPPPGLEGRRREDLSLEVGDADTPNMNQHDIDALLPKRKALL
jgi:DNA-binding response OmpR family regulator